MKLPRESAIFCCLTLCVTGCLGDDASYEDWNHSDESGFSFPSMDVFSQAALMLQIMDAWSTISEPVSALRELTPGGIQMLSGGLIAGVASRIFEADMISHGLKAAKIEDSCRKMVACELGNYILHTNEHLAELLLPVYRELFKPTSKYWKHMLRGLRGAMCLDMYPSCKRDGYYMRR